MAKTSKKTSKKNQEFKKFHLKRTGIGKLCEKAWLILKHTHNSSQALFSAYWQARSVRAYWQARSPRVLNYSVRGISTSDEQDLLRSMLVTAASGLDAMTKQLVRDTLPILLKSDESARSKLEDFVCRKIKNEDGKEPYFLAHILTAPSIQEQMIEDYISQLTKGSLQSAGELSKIASALALDNESKASDEEVKIDHKNLKPIFEARNQIIHELDIKFDGRRGKRNRRSRSLKKMKEYTETLIGLGENILTAVNKKLKTSKKANKGQN